MKKIIIPLTVLFLILLSTNVYAKTSLQKAEALYDLGIMKGTGGTFSEKSMEMDRNATRAEMCATVIRMLGKEEKANYQKNPHPFKDVPSWASNCIGWLYENYIVSGTSSTYFGANDIASVKQYSALLLRVLGFSEAKGDFKYNDAAKFAVNYGLITPQMANYYELSRETMIVMSYNALTSRIKNSNRTLIQKLIDEGAVNKTIAENIGMFDDTESLSNSFADVPEVLGDISVVVRGDKFRITFDDYVEGYGLRIFAKENGKAMREINLTSGEVYYKKGEVTYLNNGAVGYLDTLVIYGLDVKKDYSFIVLKTSSESELYKTYGKSKVVSTKD